MSYDKKKKDYSQSNSEKNTPMKFNVVTKSKKKGSVKKGTDKKSTKKKPRNGVKNNLITKSGIHSSQKKKLMDHAVDHSKRHINFMIGKLENGSKYSEAHMLAQQTVGK